MNINQHVLILYLVSKYGSPDNIRQALAQARESVGELSEDLFSVIALEVIEWFTRNQLLSQLYLFSDVLNEEGFGDLAGIGFGEVESRAIDSNLKELARRNNIARRTLESSIGLPDWYVDPECIRSLYRQGAQDSEYQCFIFENPTANRIGTIEIISDARLILGGFEDYDKWEAYLEELNKMGIISLIQTGRYASEPAQSYVLYEIPQGMKTLSECLQQDNVRDLLTPSASQRIARAIVTILIDTSRNGFGITAIDTLNVLWNPLDQDRIRLLNIGASLGQNKFVCGVERCSVPTSGQQYERTSAIYNLGLLLMQLLRRECPLLALASLQSRYEQERKNLPDLLRIRNTSPQLRSVVGRLVHRVPEHRYHHLAPLLDDLNEVVNFTNALPEQKYIDERDNSSFFTLQHYTNFRLRIISRNPRMQTHQDINRAYEILSSLSRDLAYLPESLRALWPTDIQWKHPYKIFPRRWQAGSISPEGRRLLGISEGWESTCNASPNRKPLTALSRLLLYRILVIEASACLASLAYTGTNIDEDLAETIKRLIIDVLSVAPEATGAEYSFSIANRSDGGTVDITMRFSLFDLEQLREFASWFLGEDELSYRKNPVSVKSIVLFLLVFYFDTEMSSDGRVLGKSVPLWEERYQKDTEDIWMLCKYAEEIELDTSSIDINAAHQDDEPMSWRFLFELVRIMRRINRGKRVRALIHYTHFSFSDGEGLVQLVLPKRGEFSFRSDEVFISGRIQSPLESFKPANVELCSPQSGRVVSSILAPTTLFSALPLPGRRISPYAAANWVRNHKALTIMFVMGLVFVLISLIDIGVNSLSDADLPLYLRLLSILPSLAPDLIVGTIEGVLRTIFPEDSR